MCLNKSLCQKYKNLALHEYCHAFTLKENEKIEMKTATYKVANKPTATKEKQKHINTLSRCATGKVHASISASFHFPTLTYILHIIMLIFNMLGRMRKPLLIAGTAKTISFTLAVLGAIRL